MTEQPAIDPVREKRARIAKLVEVGSRVGYTLFGIAIVVFIIGFFSGFDGIVGPLITGSIVIGSIILAPAIVFGYAVKAAEREDRERGL
jgi:hypothetical protein